MTTIKGSCIVSMPDNLICDVRGLFRETQMSSRDFRNFTRIVQSSTMKYLDHTGLVSVEEQKPVAFRQFLDEVKKCDPTIAKRYPYLWPVLAYLELYLFGRRQRYSRRHPSDTTKRPRRCNVHPPVPVWIRFARSEKTGKSLREISTEPATCVSRSTPRWNRRQPVAKQKCKTAAVTKVDENITQPIDSSPSGGSNGFAAPIGHFLWSLGPSIEGIYSHFVRGLGGEFS